MSNPSITEPVLQVIELLVLHGYTTRDSDSIGIWLTNGRDRALVGPDEVSLNLKSKGPTVTYVLKTTALDQIAERLI
jgi:hypothetical protein